MSANDCTIVSVVIPTYNYGHYVVDAVASALAQTLRGVEVIVVDDGSTDDTCRQLAPFGERIRYIYQRNSGLSAARNTGIRAATGEWIALLDADDVWHPEKNAAQIRVAGENPDVVLIGSPPAVCLPEHLDICSRSRPLDVVDFLTSSPIGPSGTLIRRRYLEQIGGFDESLRSVEDRDMWLRLAVQFRCVLVDLPCWWYREHPGQMNRNAQRMYENYRCVLEKFFAAHPQYGKCRRVAYSRLYRDAAWSFFAQGERGRSVGFLFRSGISHPGWSGVGGGWGRMKLLLRIAMGERLFRRLRPGATF